MTSPTRKAIEAARRANLKHGQARIGQLTPEYRAWAGMKARCLNPNNSAYGRYGGRGIRVSPKWINSFTQFLADLGPRPSATHSLDRRDNDRGYTALNCRWATKVEQSRNRRGRKPLTIRGETRLLVEWAERSGLDVRRIWKRVQSGWSAERAVFNPARSRATLTTCKAGHRYTPETTRWVDHGRARVCRICRREYLRRWQQQQRVE